MKPQFIALLVSVETSYSMMLINVAEIVTITGLYDKGTEIRLKDGRVLRSLQPFAQILPMITDASAIAPSAMGAYSQEAELLNPSTRSFPGSEQS
ncbi:hypothetical protein DYU11_21160 [Fibrisoma montanum]|uniref:Uncharacterized protein n=1 Tax=Fibrisoma montanum TaxID=2305895 RepID=A0A418M417_9BACT|nr:hypothetical protein [Fibrisoma montanum]RIV20557.1 hypothetical protein DYU11_21160 [Fibrisoma montanum]